MSTFKFAATDTYKSYLFIVIEIKSNRENIFTLLTKNQNKGKKNGPLA